MKQQSKFKRLIVFLLGIICLSQIVGTIFAQRDFLAAPSDKIIIRPVNGKDVAYALATQSDGKLVVAGQSSDASKNKFSLVRYNANGSLDTTFGTGGKVLTAVGTFSGANAVAVLADGKILAAGSSNSNAVTQTDSALVKYNSNGTLDTSFGSGGISIVDLSGGYNDGLNALVIQSDGKIVVAGHTQAFTTLASPLARFNSNGTLDVTFGSGGIVYTSIRGLDSTAYAVAMQGTKIIVAGDTGFHLGDSAALARFNSDGSPDYSFGSGDGTVRFFEDTNQIATAKSLAFVSTYAGEDKIVATGSMTTAGNGTINQKTQAIVWSCSAYDGSPDGTFGTYGRIINPLEDSANSAVKVQVKYGVSNSIVVAGRIGSTAVVSRYRLDGTFDTTFNGSGTKVLDTGAIYALSLQASDGPQQSDSKIVVTGTYGNDFRTIRSNTSGALDTTFDGDGIRTDNIGVN